MKKVIITLLVLVSTSTALAVSPFACIYMDGPDRVDCLDNVDKSLKETVKDVKLEKQTIQIRQYDSRGRFKGYLEIDE